MAVFKHMHCMCTMRKGILTTQSGRQFDLGKVEETLEQIAAVEVNANSEVDVIAYALDECITMANNMLQELKGQS